MKITYYLDVTSSWCFWAEPAWAELRQRFAGRVEFDWKIALLDVAVSPVSRTQMDWFYRRSGTIMRAPQMLKSSWFTGPAEYLVPNLLAEAGKDLGVHDDRLRLALAHAALIEGREVLQWEVALEVVASQGIKASDLRVLAESAPILERVKKSTADFHALQITQRPAFVLDDEIGDRVVFSGLAKAAPIAAAVEAMLADVAAYASYAVHHGAPPAS